MKKTKTKTERRYNLTPAALEQRRNAARAARIANPRPMVNRRLPVDLVERVDRIGVGQATWRTIEFLLDSYSSGG